MSGPGLPNRQKEPLSPWQQFWSSPWTWLLFSIFFFWNAHIVHHTVWSVIYYVLGFLTVVLFFYYGDKKWGRRL